jgi:nitroreductase
VIDKAALPNNQAPTDDIWEALFTQRAIRYWQDKPVPRALLAQVISAAAQAPSGENSQPWVFVVVDDAQQRAQIGTALRELYNRTTQLQTLFAEGATSDDPSQRLMLTGARAFFTSLEKAPALIIPCLYRLSSPTPDPASLLAGSSIYLAVQNALLSARALGLGTVMSTAHVMIEPALRQILSLPADAYPVALIPIGYPDANFGPTRRKDVHEVLKWNTWS